MGLVESAHLRAIAQNALLRKNAKAPKKPKLPIQVATNMGAGISILYSAFYETADTAQSVSALNAMLVALLSFFLFPALRIHSLSVCQSIGS